MTQATFDGTTGAPRQWLHWAVTTAVATFAFVLAWLVWDYNVERSCTLQEWPPLQNCPPSSQRTTATQQQLEAVVRRNPGDSQAWIQLALLTHQPGKPSDAASRHALKTATLLAGEDYRVQRLQASLALQERRWSDAVDWLLRLTRDNGRGDAAVALASLLQQPLALSQLQTHVKPDSKWLGTLIDAMPSAKVPAVAMMPVMVRALEQKAITLELLQKILRSLTAQGAWLDAHAFWTAWLGKPVPFVFNGTFDQGFLPGGFDWNILPVAPSKAGALVSQVAFPGQGGVLLVDFNGRLIQPQPLVEQQLILLDTEYVLKGEVMANKLADNAPLQWRLQCVASKTELARTAPFSNKTGEWTPFLLKFNIPPTCGPAVTLSLLSGEAANAAANRQRGQVWFDNLRLESVP